MAVKASAETIREMKKQIAQTIKDIERINQGIRSGIRASGSWDDAKAAEFNMLMQKIARLNPHFHATGKQCSGFYPTQGPTA